ncbi:PrgI family protein [Streptomyces sp. NBC_00006]|uniref:PrgI family protein n=1 Tax=unclassified Streptomyces TaxID=2593676 RepID=UPI00224EC139|nr:MULTISPECIES: PrgI family protein [unclassified Streptomyces]MCX5535767.1 PrgI family protein [Streptomyces sp. NBC_00006]
MNAHEDDLVTTVKIPSDINRSDKVLGPFTARQAASLAVVALTLYGGYWATHPFMAPLAYLALVTPIAGVAAVVALGRREGVDLDRFALAAIAHHRTPKRQVHAPEGVPPLPQFLNSALVKAAGPEPAPMRMPYDGITIAGVLDLGDQGHAAVATCTTVNFDLRSGAEQQALTAGFARWLNSLTGPSQLLVRCHRIDLAPLADRLQHEAPALPHPALEEAARAHASFLTQLATGGSLLARQIVLVAREPSPVRRSHQAPAAKAGRAVQRLDEAARALASADITLAPLDAEATGHLLEAACSPDTPTASAPSPEGALS